MAQLHKKFTDSQIKELLERYVINEIERKYIQQVLGIKDRRFFILIKRYRENPKGSSIQYSRKAKTRGITPSIEENLIKELSIEKELIQDENVPLKSYNYSYIKDLLEKKYNQTVSLPTIIDRAKKNDFYLKKRP
ncbi:MAG TPA: hypothetical protein VI935_07195, partial [Thermodesulfobacteriota bacterium]|nr:hypothetical protein [Thermodesulfobacteriota bacterium]